MKIFEIQEEIDELNSYNMTEQRFWGLKGALDDDDDLTRFDYGREILRMADYDRRLEKHAMPYEVFPLFLPTEWEH